MDFQNKNINEQVQTGLSERGKGSFDAGEELDNVLYGDWSNVFKTDDFDESQDALDKVKSLSEFRKKAKTSSSKFLYKLTEGLTKIDESRFNINEKGLLKKELTEKLIPDLQKSSPRVADFYKSLLSSVDGINRKAQFEMTDKKVQDFLGENGLDILNDSRIDWQNKSELIEKRLEGYIKGARALDYLDRKKQNIEEENDEENTNPPEADDESKPGMDEMERNEGDEIPLAIWSISPAYGGYYKSQSFDVWDNERNAWKTSGYRFKEIEVERIVAWTGIGENEIGISAHITPGRWTRLPIPYTHEVSNKVLADFKIKKDQNGNIVVLSNVDSISLILKKVRDSEEARFVESFRTEPPKMNFTLTEETANKVAEIKKSKKGKLAQAYALASHTIRHLNYSNDSSFNSIYNSHENGYVGGIDFHRMADCDVGNTYFAGLCSLLDISVRHCVGHSVKGRDKEGNSRITSGTGHAWSEVYDDVKRRWVRIDATPSGDPQMDEEKEKSDGVPVPGDYGEQEAVGHTDEELEKLQQDLEKLNTELSYTFEERDLAKGAGIELKEARKIMLEIKEAENIRLKNGERVVDILSGLFNRIVESRKVHNVEYRGPLREREGGEDIDDIVAHTIGIRSKDFDPISRVKPHDVNKTEKIISDFDFILIGDKSGSMGGTVDGEAKWKMQRKAEYLLFSSLNHFGQRCKKAGIEKDRSLNIRTQGISFRNSNIIDEDKPLSADFGPKEKLGLWKSMGNQGSGNGDVAALSMVYEQIKNEIEQNNQQGKVENRLRIVVACSDGYPDDVAGVRNMSQKLSDLGVVVVGIGMTETARSVKTIFDTPYSKGDFVKSIDEMPVVVAKYIIAEATRLFPDKALADNKDYIKRLLKKFE